MNIDQFEWLQKTIASAVASDHIFPEMAACEAALESGYGTSALARQGNNLFGMKQHQHAIYGTLTLPTKEFLDGQWMVVNADWVKYDTPEECFADRMETLRRLQDVFPHYAAALAANDELTYISEVSKSWSTDPDRAHKCIQIYIEFQGLKAQCNPISYNNAEEVADAANGEK